MSSKNASIKLDFVRLASLLNPDGTPKGANGVTAETRVVKHPQGIPTWLDKEGNVVPAGTVGATQELCVNESTGDRSGEARPFVVIGFSQQLGTQKHLDVSPHWGRYRQDGSKTIIWQGLDPNTLLRFLDGFVKVTSSNGETKMVPVHDAAYIYTIAMNVDEPFWPAFQTMDIIDGYDRLAKMGIEKERVGRFVTLPSEDPIVAGMGILPFEIERGGVKTQQTSVTRFLYQDEIDRGPQWIARAFIQKDVRLNVTRVDDQTGQSKLFLNQAMLEQQQAARTISDKQTGPEGTNKLGNQSVKNSSTMVLPRLQEEYDEIKALNDERHKRMEDLENQQKEKGLNPEEAIELDDIKKEIGKAEIRIGEIEATK